MKYERISKQFYDIYEEDMLSDIEFDEDGDGKGWGFGNSRKAVLFDYGVEAAVKLSGLPLLDHN